MYVLVHGAGMSARCWDRLLPFLDAPAVVVDLPGRGSRADMSLHSLTLDDCAQAILDDVADRGGDDDLTLVAHSFGGVSVPRVMNPLGTRLRHVAFLSAVVPPDGTRVIDQIDPSVREAVRESIASGIYSIGQEEAKALLCGDLDDDQTAWTLSRVVDDSAALLTEQVNLSGLHTDVPRTYIRLTEDACYPPNLQERSAAIVGGAMRQMKTGHMAMVAAPEDLAKLLIELV